MLLNMFRFLFRKLSEHLMLKERVLLVKKM